MSVEQRRVDLGRIHALKKAMGIDDEDYRFMLEQWTGCSSCKDMDAAQLGVVRSRMEDLGRSFGVVGGQPQAGRGKAAGKGKSSPSRKPAANDYPPGCSQPQWRKICWLRNELRWNDKNLRGYIRHVTGLEHERFLTVATAREVISGLEGVMRHEERKLRSKRAGPAGKD